MLDDGIEIDTSELDGLAELLDRFPLDVQDKLVKQAVGAGAAVLMLGVMEKTPVRTDFTEGNKSNALAPGMVKADIHAVAGRTGRVWFIGAGPRTAYVMRWLERGHLLVRGGKGKHQIGHVPPHSVLRSAFDEYWKTALHATAIELEARIAEYWRKTLTAVKRAA